MTACEQAKLAADAALESYHEVRRRCRLTKVQVDNRVDPAC